MEIPQKKNFFFLNIKIIVMYQEKKKLYTRRQYINECRNIVQASTMKPFINLKFPIGPLHYTFHDL